EVTSAAMATLRRPSPSIARAVAARSSPEERSYGVDASLARAMSETATSTPSRASASAIARPRPRAAPVTSAIFPVSSIAAPLVGSADRVEARDVAPHDQRGHVVRALVGVHGLEVHHVADHRVLVHDAVGAQDVAREARDLERDADVVALRERDLLGAHA